jgi:ketopantoate reductase
MRIAVIGAGGVGGYFGAHLAVAGHEVVFGARGWSSAPGAPTAKPWPRPV